MPSPGCCHLSRRAALLGDAKLRSWSSAPLPPSHRHTSGLAQPTDLREPTPAPLPWTNPFSFCSLAYHVKHHGQIKPSATRSPSTRGEDCGRIGASLQEKATTKPGGNASGRAGTRQVSNTASAWRAQRRAPPAARCAGNSLHDQVFSTTPLF